MKIINNVILTILTAIVLVACESRLDIVPKGEITLDRIEELELLLNQEYKFGTWAGSDLGVIANTNVAVAGSIENILSNKSTYAYAALTYDETINRPSIYLNDSRYNAVYKSINNMNTIIAKAYETTGSVEKKNQVIAEAHIMRAYLHFLMVNIHAAQYDEATAANLGGIPYVSDINLGEIKSKRTVAEVYDNILLDCGDEYIDVLPDCNDDCVRADRGFANAVRATVLFQMKRYAEAIPYAKTALAIRGTIDDRSVVKETLSWALQHDSKNNYVYMSGGNYISPGFTVLSYETKDLIDPDDFLLKYEANGWNEPMAAIMGGMPGSIIYYNSAVRQNVYGIRTEQIYYLLGEALIRTGEIDNGLAEIDKVREKRIENYKPFAGSVSTEAEAMELVRNAKAVEMIGSYQTFFDCKRWNSEPAYARVITRNLRDHGSFSISPDSPLWIFPFPASATRINPTLTQNF